MRSCAPRHPLVIKPADLGIPLGSAPLPASSGSSRSRMLSRLSARLSSCGGGAGSSSSAALQLWHGTPLRWAAAVRGLASTVRPPSVRDAQIRIFGWAQPEAGKRGETRHGHAPMKTLEKLKRRGLIAEKVRVPPRRRLLSLGSARLLTRTTPLPLSSCAFGRSSTTSRGPTPRASPGILSSARCAAASETRARALSLAPSLPLLPSRPAPQPPLQSGRAHSRPACRGGAGAQPGAGGEAQPAQAAGQGAAQEGAGQAREQEEVSRLSRYLTPLFTPSLQYCAV